MSDKIISQDSSQSYLFSPPVITPEIWSALGELFYIAAVLSEQTTNQPLKHLVSKRLNVVADQLKPFLEARPYRRDQEEQ
jgi:hypothetical protein